MPAMRATSSLSAYPTRPIFIASYYARSRCGYTHSTSVRSCRVAHRRHVSALRREISRRGGATRRGKPIVTWMFTMRAIAIVRHERSGLARMPDLIVSNGSWPLSDGGDGRRGIRTQVKRENEDTRGHRRHSFICRTQFSFYRGFYSTPITSHYI